MLFGALKKVAFQPGWNNQSSLKHFDHGAKVICLPALTIRIDACGDPHSPG